MSIRQYQMIKRISYDSSVIYEVGKLGATAKLLPPDSAADDVSVILADNTVST
jgi:hypothetical protein